MAAAGIGFCLLRLANTPSGVIRMVSLTKDGIERFFFADKDIPLYFNRE